jgi:acetyl esterase/lipase
MRRLAMCAGLMIVWTVVAHLGWATEPRPAHPGNKAVTIDVWPGKPPGDKAPIAAEKVLPTKPGQACQKPITNVSRPTLTIYHPPGERDRGAAVVIAPGGGYHILAWDLEGEEVAQWLNSIGVTAILLKYRVPRRPGTGDAPPIQALMDAQRALSLVRSKAGAWGIDPKRVGMLGFSAGGHLAAWTCTNFDRRAYEAVDDIDQVSCRPDFAILIYPAYLLAKDGSALAPEVRIGKHSPPMFLAHAGDDGIPADNSIQTYRALKKAGVPSELHVYASGGHGFGLRATGQPCTSWPHRCADWLRAQRVLTR